MLSYDLPVRERAGGYCSAVGRLHQEGINEERKIW